MGTTRRISIFLNHAETGPRFLKIKTFWCVEYVCIHRRWSCAQPRHILVDFLQQFRDDNKKLHPCLVEFQSLPEPERNYNLQMSGETLKWVYRSGCVTGQLRLPDIHPWQRLKPNWTPVSPQDAAGFGLPCWNGRWESRRESEEDQAAQDVRRHKHFLFDLTCWNVLTTSLFVLQLCDDQRLQARPPRP